MNSAHLLHLCRYIHANPVKDEIVTGLDYWPYSNYLEWVGKRSGTLVDRAFVIECFSTSQLYFEYVMDYLRTKELPEAISAYRDDWEVK